MEKAKDIAKIIMGMHTFRTLTDTEEILYYDKGCYRFGGEIVIKYEIEKEFLSDQVTRAFVGEVTAHIQRSTYIYRDRLDNNAKLIVVENGILDLRTKQLLEPSPDILLLTKIPVLYDSSATCPNIEQFLNQIVSQEDKKTLLEFIGYCLWKDYSIHKILLLFGETNAGKSTFIEMVRAFLGKVNCSSSSLQDIAEQTFIRAELYAKLSNLHADIPKRLLRDTSILKTLTGGDTITAQKKYHSPFQFKNYAKLIFSANELPPTSDLTNAFFNRFIIMNFPNKFEGNKMDRNLLAKLTTPTELSGLLNLALDYFKGNISCSQSAEQLRKTYIDLSDPISAFIRDRIKLNPARKIRLDELYSNFMDYCQQTNKRPVLKRELIKTLMDKLPVTTYRTTIAGETNVILVSGIEM